MQDFHKVYTNGSTKKGGFGQVFKITKESTDKSEMKTQFIVKITKRFSQESGCNNGLEILILQKLSKVDSMISPYLDHIELDMDTYPISNQPKDNEPEKLTGKQFALIMKHYDYDLNELIHFFMDTPEDLNIDQFGINRVVNLKRAFYENFYRGRQPNNYIHESLIELTILNIMKTLYALVDMCTENGSSNKIQSQLKFKTIAHGDIKPMNILIQSSKNRRPEIVLIDYGTCGPNESADVKRSKYAGTVSHLPTNRITDEDIRCITNTYRVNLD